MGFEKNLNRVLKEWSPDRHADEQYDGELSLYWHEGMWHIGDGTVPSNYTDRPAEQSIQMIGQQVGATDAMNSGKIDPDQFLFDIKFDISHQGSYSYGRRGTPDDNDPPYSNVETNASGAVVKIEWDDAAGMTQKKEITLPSNLESALMDDYGEAFAEYAADRYADAGSPTYDRSDYEDYDPDF